MLGFLQYVGVPWVWHLMDRVPSQLCEVDGKVFPDLADQAGGWLTGTYIACSSGLVDEINSDGFRLNGRIEVLPNWVEGPRPPARTRFFRRGERLRIAFAGQVVAAKGADIVIEAAAMLKAAGHIEFSIDLFGTVYELKYQHAIDAAGLSDAVRLLGLLPQTELIKRYDGYDVFIFPTYRREPFGFAPLEAVSRECVALISEDCGIAEWLVDRVHLLKTPRFASDFAQVLNDVIEGRLDLEPIGRAGANVVWRDFEVDTVMGSVASLLDEAASRPAGALGSIADAFSLAARAEHLAQTALLRR
jgi:glycosyltransferase involved in cell wall biosynthesis